MSRFWNLDSGFWIAVVAVGLLFAGCDRHESSGSSASTPPKVAVGPPKYGTGTIRGKVKFVGTAPKRAEIPNQPCHADARSPLLDETVVVNQDTGTLANVLVYLADAPASDGATNEKAVLDQKDCQYVPHVVGVQVNQRLRVGSSDPKTLHNVHYDPSSNRAGNFGLTDAGAEKTVTFDNPEFIRVKCDVHPWMSAYVGVFDHPFFATSDERTGEFEIARVPAGTYKLAAWHEQFGQAAEQQVVVADDAVVEVEVTYEKP